MTPTEINIKNIIKDFAESSNGTLNVENDTIKKYGKSINNILDQYLYEFDTEETRLDIFNIIKQIPEINYKIKIESRKDKLDKINERSTLYNTKLL